MPTEELTSIKKPLHRRRRSALRLDRRASAGSPPRRARSPTSSVRRRRAAARRVAAARPARWSRRASRRARTRPTRCRSGCGPADEGWSERVIVEADGWTVYDALADPAHGPRAAAPRCAAARASAGQDGTCASAGRERPPPGCGGTVDVRPVGVEQSNSSIVFGEQLILKAFRRAASRASTPSSSCCASCPRAASRTSPPLRRLVRGRGRACSTRRSASCRSSWPARRDGWELALDELASDPEALLDRCARSATVIGELHTALGSDDSDPDVRARRALDRGARRSLVADVDEQIERVFLDLPEDSEARGADPRPRPGRARAARAMSTTSAPAGA